MRFESTFDAAGPKPETGAPGNLRPLPVEWLPMAGSLPVVFFHEKAAPVPILRLRSAARLAPRLQDDSQRPVGRSGRGTSASRRATLPRPIRAIRAFRPIPRPPTRASGFTLLELLTVVAIVGLLAAMTLPHLKGFSRTNSMSAATRQLLDDVAYARQRAIANRSTVLMVFAPPDPWNYMNLSTNMALPHQTLTNLLNDQYRGYALVSLRTVGDQPGRWRPSYLTDWKALPSGVLFATNMFVNTNTSVTGFVRVFTTNTIENQRNEFDIYPFTNSYTALPFPTLQTKWSDLPYIAFSPSGALVDEYGHPLSRDQYIPLTAGGLLLGLDNNGNPTLSPALVNENPPGNWTNNPVLVHIDATTGRAKIERNQL